MFVFLFDQLVYILFNLFSKILFKQNTFPTISLPMFPEIPNPSTKPKQINTKNTARKTGLKYSFDKLKKRDKLSVPCTHATLAKIHFNKDENSF